MHTFEEMIHVPRSMLRSHLRTQVDLTRRQARVRRSFPFRIFDFLSINVLGWVYHYLKSRFGPKYPFQDYTHSPGDNGVYPLSDDPRSTQPIRIGVTGDWGTGTAEAAAVASGISAFDPHFTIHLGDVYFVGAPHEVRENCLTEVRWPHGSRGAFALNGNHEMYARGKAYFTIFLPTLGPNVAGGKPAGQKASFFCLQNDYWRIVCLDTGYNSLGIPILEMLYSPNNRLPQALVDWLRDVVRLGDADDKRGLILMSHHQYYSAFDDDVTAPAAQIAALLKPNRPVLWFWGHEHRLAFYGKFGVGTPLEAYGRCIGNGGMPDDLADIPAKAATYQLKVYDNREYKNFLGIGIGFNGFTNLTLAGDRLTAEYCSVNQSLDGDTLLARETWRIDLGTGLLVGPEFEVLDKGLTVVAPF